ncbi:MAG: hypothetical protein ACR652_00400 [Methylocystis sp.]|uniref:hypothetical protein n=1 Tax=Methylocystis sp. TaxID=1911079 RepID=UPI003DA6BEF0
MKLILRAEPEAGDTAAAIEISSTMAQADFEFMLNMGRSIYDEMEPKQATDTNGALLFVGSDGADYTEAQKDANTNGSLTFTPKYRARTDFEAWAKIGAGLTKGTWANAVRRKKELDARAAQTESPPDRVPATPLVPAVI